MKYLILNNKIIDKAEKEFPVSPEMEWMEIDGDFPIGSELVDGIPVVEEYTPTYIDLRLEAYGGVQEQLEFIVENGLEAFITRQNDIKTQFPKQE